MYMNSDQIKQVKSDYTVGTRIKMISMDDPHAPIESGTLGTVRFVDDGGTIHVKWDNGRTLGVRLEVDQVSKVE